MYNFPSKEYKDYLNEIDNRNYDKRRQNLRPIYFINVVWGKEYLNYLLNYHLASLLSSKNLPILKNKKINKYLIASPKKDIIFLKKNKIIKKVSKYLTFEFFEIPECPKGLSGCVHMGIGHKILTEIAYNNRAYAVLLTPDLILSDGCLGFIEYLAVQKYEVVLTTALRFGTEPLFKNLKKEKYLSPHKINQNIPLTISSRGLVKNSIKSLHSQTMSYEFECDSYSEFPVATWWWKDKKKDGMIIYSFSWAPLLVDYNSIHSHDTSMMDNWTIDGNYIHQNFDKSNIYTSYDSDEIMLVSWGSMEIGKVNLRKKNFSNFQKKINILLKKVRLNYVFRNPVMDPLKRKIVKNPTLWHVNDVSGSWFDRIDYTKIIINSALASESETRYKLLKLQNITYIIAKSIIKFLIGNIFRIKRVVIYYSKRINKIPKFLMQIFTDFPTAKKRLISHLKLLWIHFLR